MNGAEALLRTLVAGGVDICFAAGQLTQITASMQVVIDD